jgi:hypothetical protein
VHLIILDTNNGKFLWKRIPKSLKDPKRADSESLIGIWEVGKALTKKQYAEAFELLNKKHKSEDVQGLIDVLIKVLREEHVIKNI